MAYDRLQQRFQHHAPSHPDVGKSHGLIREACFETAKTLTVLCPFSPEYRNAITKLEEAMFWANAAIARNQTEALSQARVSGLIDDANGQQTALPAPPSSPL